jgi:hypothetical protein
MCILGSRASEDMKASRREMDRAFSCLIIVRSYREELPRAYSNRARINRPVRPYSGHYALTVDCKFPSQPIGRQLGNLRLRTCDPPPIRRSTRLKPQYHSRPSQPGYKIGCSKILHCTVTPKTHRGGEVVIRSSRGEPLFTHWTHKHRSPGSQPPRRGFSFLANKGLLSGNRIPSLRPPQLL